MITTISDFEINGKRLLIRTSDIDNYIHFLKWQNEGDVRWYGLETLEEKQKFASFRCQEKFTYFYNSFLKHIDTSKVKKVIDVGSGVGVIDLLLSQYLPDTELYLLDKNTIEQPKIPNYFSNSLDEENYHGFYNSFDLVKDVISNSPINEEKINLLSPDDQWPEDVDIIFSTYSWMWHYHKDIYWSRLLKSLKVGGYLMTSMTLRDGDTTVEDISQDLGSVPLSSDKLQLHHSSIDRSRVNFDKIIYTGFYVWQRLK